MILFDDQNMRVLYEQRDPSTLVITFAPRSVVADGEHFWARDALANIGVSAIGFMPKQSNWFAPSYMERALDSVADITPSYDRVILYGGSAGAYAAAKWSRRLGAHYSICLAPQWTIDPAEIGQKDRRFQEYFTDEMRGMGLQSADLAGEIFVFCDPYHVEDLHNAAYLLALAPAVKLISCPYMHHSVIELFLGRQPLADAIAACSRNAQTDLTRVAGKFRRQNKHRFLFLLAKVFEKRPDLAIAFLKDRSGSVWDNDSFFLMLGDYINSRGQKRYADKVFAYGLAVFPQSAQLKLRKAHAAPA